MSRESISSSIRFGRGEVVAPNVAIGVSVGGNHLGERRESREWAMLERSSHNAVVEFDKEPTRQPTVAQVNGQLCFVDRGNVFAPPSHSRLPPSVARRGCLWRIFLGHVGD